MNYYVIITNGKEQPNISRVTDMIEYQRNNKTECCSIKIMTFYL